MADYYPLLARAVTGLQKATPEARRAIYDRARDALLGQLRSITPALPDQDIERESDALDAAVNRLEDELAADATRRERAETGTAQAAPAQRRPRRDGPPLPTPGVAGAAQESRASRDGNVEGVARRADRRRIEPMHPAAPTPQTPRQSKARIWIFGLTIIAVVAMIGATAYFLRDDPQDLVRTKPVEATPATAGAVGKITGRAGGSGKAAATNPVPARPVAVVPIEVPKPTKPGPSSTGSPATPSAPPASPASPPQPARPSGPVAADAPKPTTPAPTPARQPVIPVTYRAALLVQAEQGSDHKTYVGTVIWRLDSVTGDPGQPLQTALRADIDIPDAKLKVSMQMQKNTDPALTASHTIVLGFVPSPDGVVKGIRSIQMPQMRNEASPGGEALLGIGIVPITPTYYLVGLQQGDANIKRNFELLTSRNWFDVQFVLDNGRAAKITFEKGAQGEIALKEAMAAWQ